MTREEHLAFCKICKNRKMNMKVGLICSLTDRIADFEDSCDNFDKDEVAEQEVFEKKMAAAGNFETDKPLDYKVTQRNGAIIFIIGCLVTIVSHMYADQTGVFVITYGAIIYGAVHYYRGVQQEKIALAHDEKKSGANKA